MRQLGTCVVDDDGAGGGGLGGYGEYFSLGGDSSSFDNMSAMLQQLWQQQRPAAAARRHSSTYYTAGTVNNNITNNDSQGSNGTAGGGEDGDTCDSSSGFIHDLSNVTPTTRHMLMLRREREAAAAGQCRTLRGALSVIMAADHSESSNKSIHDMATTAGATGATAATATATITGTAAATAAGGATYTDPESQGGSLDDGGSGRTGSRGNKGGGSWAAAAAVALSAAAAASPPYPSRPSSPPTLPRPPSLVALLHQWSVGAPANGSPNGGLAAPRGAAAAAAPLQAAATATAAAGFPGGVEAPRPAGGSGRRSSMPYNTSTAGSPFAAGLLASFVRRRSSAVSSYNHILQLQLQPPAPAAATAVAPAAAAAGGGSPRPSAAASLASAAAGSVAGVLPATEPQSPVQGGGSSQVPAVPPVLTTPAATADSGPGGSAAAAATAAASASPASVNEQRTSLSRVGWSLRRSRHSNGPASAPSLAAALLVQTPQQAAATLLEEGADTFCAFLPPPPPPRSVAAGGGTPRGSGGGAGAGAGGDGNGSGSLRASIDGLRRQPHQAAAGPAPAVLQAMPSDAATEAAAAAADFREVTSPFGTRHGHLLRAGEETAVVDVARLLVSAGSGKDGSSRRRASAAAAAPARYRTNTALSNSYGSYNVLTGGGGRLLMAGGGVEMTATASGAHVRVREELVRPATPVLVPTAAAAAEALALRAPMLDKVRDSYATRRVLCRVEHVPRTTCFQTGRTDIAHNRPWPSHAPPTVVTN